MSPTAIRALWQTGHLHAEQLPEIAVELLFAGEDSLPLRQLAGLLHPTSLEAEALLDRALNDLGVPRLGRNEACRSAASAIASRVLTGAVDPYSGARSLAGLWSDCGGPNHLSVFVAAVDEWDDCPSARAEIEGLIRQACGKLVADEGK
jgi:hypothetical protein